MVEFKIQENRIIKYERVRPPVAVGYIQEDYLMIQRNAKEHLHFVHNGWGLDCGLIESLSTGEPAPNVKMRPGTRVKFIQLYDNTFKDTYYTDVETAKEFGIKEDYGNHGEQYILPKTYWSVGINDYERRSNSFIHLHVHSDYSTLDGIGSVEEYVYSARRMGMSAVALTDHGTVFGLSRFYKACKEAGVKPILGSEFYIVDDMEVKESRVRQHAVVLAKNLKGYKNLLALSTESYLSGFYYKPRIDKNLLLKYKEGLMVTSGCCQGYIYRFIEEGNIQKAEVELQWWKERFGEDFYIELHSDSLEVYAKNNHYLVLLAEKYNIKLIAVNDVHYTYKTDVKCHNVMLGIQMRKSIHDNPGFTAQTYWFTSQKETEEMFEEFQPQITFGVIEEAMRNTLEVAAKVEEYEIKTELNLPKPNLTASLPEIVESKTLDLLKGIDKSLWNEYAERVDMELRVIAELKFQDYFLLIADIVNWAKSKGIQVGAGRGSVAGSLVSYVLGITDVDPIKHKLIFERFLNPGRKTPPDIDIDFDSRRREEVVAFISEKYKVARISTAVRLQGRGVIRDVARVYGLSLKIVDLITKLIFLGHSIDQAYSQVPQFERLYNDHKEILDIARRLEGIIKTVGQHPAGVIVSDEDIGQYMALKRLEGQKGEIAVQGDMEDVDDIGLIKVDLLGSKTQTILSKCVEESGINLKSISLEDEKVFEVFAAGDSEDIFQFNSELGIDTLKLVKPKNFEELTAVSGLIRPGASDFIKSFADRSYSPVIKDMEEILSSTRNIILYQEQSMEVSVKIAGFSLAKADDLRKAIGKKLPKLMSSLRGSFIEGGVKNGHASSDMAKVFGIIEKSSSYAFNRSHAVAYALSSYWSMWFKVHHPTIFAVAGMTVEAEGNKDKLKRYIHTALKRGLVVLPPDINKSEWEFTYDEAGIRCGLGMIKNFSENAFKYVKKVRPFKNFYEFLEKIVGNKRVLNKRAAQSLIKAGAFDGLSELRRPLWSVFETKKQDKVIVESLLGSDKEWDDMEKSAMEFEALGFYFTTNPIKIYAEEIERFKITKSKFFKGFSRTAVVRVAGIVSKITPYDSANGSMAFVDITGHEDDYSINIWSSGWKKLRGKFKEGDVVVFQGTKLDGNKISLDFNANGKFKNLSQKEVE